MCFISCIKCLSFSIVYYSICISGCLNLIRNQEPWRFIIGYFIPSVQSRFYLSCLQNWEGANLNFFRVKELSYFNTDAKLCDFEELPGSLSWTVKTQVTGSDLLCNGSWSLLKVCFTPLELIQFLLAPHEL